MAGELAVLGNPETVRVTLSTGTLTQLVAGGWWDYPGTVRVTLGVLGCSNVGGCWWMQGLPRDIQGL